MQTIPGKSRTTAGGGVQQRVLVVPQQIARRNIELWLPPDAASAGRPYPVIYMHDGQNLFDPGTAQAGSWQIDLAIEGLISKHGLRGAIVVGIWNNGLQRWREYAPQQPFEAMQGTAAWKQYLAHAGGPPLADAYLAFLVEELKPWIDARYATLPQQEHTFVMGSSMGGLISLYALERYPAVFGGAACLSTHWPAGGNALVDALGAALPPAGRHRLYFDYGTATLDSDYEPFQLRMDRLLSTAGYSHGNNWLTRKFPGAEHSERAWRARVHIPLAFLLSETIIN